jgi:hypothetical protein
METIDDEILERTLNWIDRRHQAGSAVQHKDQAGDAGSAGTSSLDLSAEW